MFDADVVITNQGSIVCFLALSEKAQEWFDTNLPPETLHFGMQYIVERRYAESIMDGIRGDDLVIKVNNHLT